MIFASFFFKLSQIHLKIHLQFSLTFRDINNTVMEMLIMAYACKTSNAKKIVGVLPYMPYSRQCKRYKQA